MQSHPETSRRKRLWITAVGFAGLMVLHIDAWRPQSGRLLLGWLPEELAYRLFWVFLAWLFLQYVCTRVWRDEGE